MFHQRTTLKRSLVAAATAASLTLTGMTAPTALAQDDPSTSSGQNSSEDPTALLVGLGTTFVVVMGISFYAGIGALLNNYLVGHGYIPGQLVPNIPVL